MSVESIIAVLTIIIAGTYNESLEQAEQEVMAAYGVAQQDMQEAKL